MTKLEQINLYKALSVHPRFEKLTEREQDILTYLAAGYTQREIMPIFKISRSRVFQIRNAICIKLRVTKYQGKRNYMGSGTMEIAKKYMQTYESRY